MTITKHEVEKYKEMVYAADKVLKSFLKEQDYKFTDVKKTEFQQGFNAGIKELDDAIREEWRNVMHKHLLLNAEEHKKMVKV
jgi:phosphoribosylaminoimidazole-succinocarboxamide synthase